MADSYSIAVRNPNIQQSIHQLIEAGHISSHAQYTEVANLLWTQLRRAECESFAIAVQAPIVANLLTHEVYVYRKASHEVTPSDAPLILVSRSSIAEVHDLDHCARIIATYQTPTAEPSTSPIESTIVDSPPKGYQGRRTCYTFDVDGKRHGPFANGPEALHHFGLAQSQQSITTTLAQHGQTLIRAKDLTKPLA